MKRCKTPLRYPGGKTRAVKHMFPHYPLIGEMKEFREGFLGGGSVAIDMTKRYPRLPIWVNDLYYPLYNFWVQLQNRGDDMSDLLYKMKQRHNTHETAKELFLSSKEVVNDETATLLDRAVAFYVVNKCSFSGLTESSSFSKMASDSNFSVQGIENLRYYHRLIENWKITNQSYETLLCDDPETFVYLDPPYDIRDSLYGKRGSMHKYFDHDLFAEHCNGAQCPILISYNADQKVTDRFPEWVAATFDLTYTMRSVGDYMKDQQKRKELLLLNYKKS